MFAFAFKPIELIFTLAVLARIFFAIIDISRTILSFPASGAGAPVAVHLIATATSIQAWVSFTLVDITLT